MSYHQHTRKCDGMCDTCDCPESVRLPPRESVAERLRKYGDGLPVGLLLMREAADEIENLRAALQWYADGLHFDKASPDAWDTVSGEPQNWWCDEAGTATVEDGSIAAMVLRGELTGAQVQALD